ncbi:hypothetical protein BRADO6198 [Bradyrhizobium sp. ORS 278]|nr:hypothetical protein BRADO6198 [Bradyrhizobium sp. ORS 278]
MTFNLNAQYSAANVQVNGQSVPIGSMTLTLTNPDTGRSSTYTEPFGVVGMHEFDHIQFPQLSGETGERGGHNNLVGDYLFRTIVGDQVKQLYGPVETQETFERLNDLAALQKWNRQIDWASITNAAQAKNAMDNNPAIQSWLPSMAQDHIKAGLYDAPAGGGSPDPTTWALQA